MRIHTLSIGRPHLVTRGGQTYGASINRKPATGAVELLAEGFVGDRVSDERVHGGPDKAVLCYPLEHYAYFAEKLGHVLEVPAFGENLTTEGWMDETACVGDTLEIGTAVVQVSQPRQPCFKLANKHGTGRMIAWVNDKAWAGFYLRVLQIGKIAAGDEVKLVARPHPTFNMVYLTHLLRADSDRAALDAVIAIPELHHLGLEPRTR